MLDQRVQPVGPHLLVDGPVAEARRVVAAAAGTSRRPGRTAPRPPGGRDVGERAEPVEAVVEVDRLPGVEHDRPRAARVSRTVADHPVEGAAEPVQPTVAVGEADHRGGVGLAPPEGHLARAEQLTTAELGHPRGVALRPHRGVTAPPDVHAPHLAGAEAETGRPGGQHQRGVVPGASPPPLAHPGPHRQRVALRCPLAAPPPAQVQQLRRARRDRQGRPEAAELVRRRRLVRHPLPHLQDAGRRELEVDLDAQARLLVGGGHPGGPRAVDLDRGDLQPGRPVGAVRSGPDEPGPHRPAVRRKRQQPPRVGLVRPGVRHRRRHRGGHLGPVGRRVERRPPVQDDRQASLRVEGQQQRHGVGVQVDV